MGIHFASRFDAPVRATVADDSTHHFFRRPLPELATEGGAQPLRPARWPGIS
jgi:hypothetical protein